jgi:hypothetical protein
MLLRFFLQAVQHATCSSPSTPKSRLPRALSRRMCTFSPSPRQSSPPAVKPSTPGAAPHHPRRPHRAVHAGTPVTARNRGLRQHLCHQNSLPVVNPILSELTHDLSVSPCSFSPLQLLLDHYHFLSGILPPSSGASHLQEFVARGLRMLHVLHAASISFRCRAVQLRRPARTPATPSRQPQPQVQIPGREAPLFLTVSC